MATLETQYKNYMEKNPLSEYTFEQWKEWFGNSIHKAFVEMELRKIRENIVNKINTQSEFELTKNEIIYIIENWMCIHTQHKMNYVQLFDNTANISINRDSIFKN
jgi:hypothetical protein